MLQALNREHGKTIIMVTHDPHASARASRTVYLNKGQLSASKPHSVKTGMNFPLLIWSNLKRRSCALSLTLLSIVVAFVLFGSCAIKQALAGGVSSGGGKPAGRAPQGLDYPIATGQLQSAHEGFLGSAASHQTWFGGYYQDPKNLFMQSPVVPEDFLAMYPGIRPAG